MFLALWPATQTTTHDHVHPSRGPQSTCRAPPSALCRLKLETVRPRAMGRSGQCFELHADDYPAVGFAFQVLQPSEVQLVARNVARVAALLCARNIAHNVFITRGYRFDSCPPDSEGPVYDAVRVFVWARETVTGGKDPAAFNVAVCELSGQLLIYDDATHRNIAEEDACRVLHKACQDAFTQVRPQIAALFG